MGAISFNIGITVTDNNRKAAPFAVDDDLHGEWTLADLLEYTKTSLIVISDEVLKEEQDAGFDKNPIMLVDGKRDTDIRNVSPLGEIQFVGSQDMGAMLFEAYNGLLDRSKVLTGQYKDSHYVFFNGLQVATNLGELQSWLGVLGQGPDFKDGDTIRIVNIQPYARRLERLGVTAQRTSVRTVEQRRKGVKTGKTYAAPNGAYQLTARAIKAKYKNNMLIRFTFLPGNLLGLPGTFKGGKGKGSTGRPYLYPSIVITVQERGIT